jgi:hypothetical protein
MKPKTILAVHRVKAQDLTRKTASPNLLVSLAALTIFWLLVEITARLLITPNEFATGLLFGVELPPYSLLPPTTPPAYTDHSAWYKELVVDDQKITIGDLWGFFRKDQVFGYAPQEGITSANGWWQSNNLGARASHDVGERTTPGQQRWLVFGDSFAVGSRVRQEEVWSSILDVNLESVEVLNFGVDGYGMGQSYLRYQAVKERLEHDLILLMFVPAEDLWRDVNTRRDLRGNWELYWVMPRFILDQGKLRLIESPFEGTAAQDQQSPDELNIVLREHLRLYDRFYFDSRFEEPWLIGKSILYKLLAKAYFNYQDQTLIQGFRDADSEASQVSRAIFAAMNDEALEDGNRFVLVFLPSLYDLWLLEHEASYLENWVQMVAMSCRPGLICIDLLPDMLSASNDQLDSGYDGTHFGPVANQLIAERILYRLNLEGVLPERQ